MKGPCIFVIDAGTGDCRVIAFSAKGAVLAGAHEEWVYQSGREEIPGAFSFQPDACWQRISDLLKEVSARLPDYTPAAITVTSQRDGMVFLDSDGSELYCAPNMDLRGADVLHQLEPFRSEILKRTGLPISALFGLPRLLWFREHDRSRYDKIDCAFMLCDWIAFKLCGEKRSERAGASSSQMLNLSTGEYDRELLRLIGLKDDCFPAACAGTEVIGTLQLAQAQPLGLLAGIPVLIGGSDTHCGLVGMGCLEEGGAAVVAGTTTPVLSLFSHPVVDPQAAVYSSCSAVSGQWALEANADSTGLSYRWVRDLFFPGQKDAFSNMAAEAANIAPGCNGMSAYIGIGVRGEEKGRNLGGFLFPVPWNISDFTRGHFFRAALESNAFAVCANLEVLYRKGAQKPAFLHLCGGQSNSVLFAQVLADSSGLPVQTYQDPECTALGAAAQAAAGIGMFPSLRDAADRFSRPARKYLPAQCELYVEIYQDWLRLHKHLLDLSAMESNSTEN